LRQVFLSVFVTSSRDVGHNDDVISTISSPTGVLFSCDSK
jgi:hypothetical protein